MAMLWKAALKLGKSVSATCSIIMIESEITLGMNIVLVRKISA
jgi:hypothetical protein